MQLQLMHLMGERDNKDAGEDKNKKSLHRPGFEPGTPAVLRQCHNQLDHRR